MKNEILATNGKIFSVEFTKKDGTIREMHCRLGVKKHLKGGKRLNPNKDHIIVWDIQKKGYRTIDTNKLSRFTFGGKTWILK